MIDRIKAELDKEVISDAHRQLLQKLKGYITQSRGKWQEYYPKWDLHDQVYKGIRKPDIEDLKSEARKEPIKIVDPLTYSQVNTFVAIAYMLLTQREKIYELIPTGPEDTNPARIIESLLEADLDYNNFRGSILPQLLRSFAKRGVCVVKYQWHKDCSYEEIEEIVEPNLLGQALELLGKEPQTKTTVNELIEFLGNKVINQSPYRFFPDVRVPLDRFQEGEYCGSEDEFTYNYLKRKEYEGKYAGIEFITDMSSDKTDIERSYGSRRISFRDSLSNFGGHTVGSESNTPKLPVLVTEVQVDLIPSEYILSDGKPLGKQKYPVKYLVEYANDQRIINIEELVYPWFTYEVAQFNADEADYISMGLADALSHLQDIITWFCNSRVDNVKKVIGNKLVIDPEAIHPASLEGNKKFIIINRAYSGRDVNQFIKQLNLQDVTLNHITDMQVLRGFAKEATGISEVLLGQASAGRRSGTQDAAVQSNAMARIKQNVDAFWFSLGKPLGKKMARNHQRYLTMPKAVKVAGLSVIDETTGQVKEDVTQMLNVTAEDLVGNYDFKVYEGTLPSDRFNMARVLQEQLVGLFTNPQMAQTLQQDPRKIFKDILKYNGIPNPEYYQASFEQMKQMYQPFLDEQNREHQKEIERQVIGDVTKASTDQSTTEQSSVSGNSQGSSQGTGIDNAIAPFVGGNGGIAGLLGGSGQ
ncbi:hypothetical protein N9064_00700 [bacterium]|nr:hypothetical protein [bacterium]